MTGQFYEPQARDLVACDDGVHYVLLDQASDFCNWVMRRHPDGPLVSVRKATAHELAHAKARQHLRTGVAMLQERAPEQRAPAPACHPDDQAEIDRLHAEFNAIDEPNNEQVMDFQDASYALGQKRGQLNGRAEGRAEAVEMILAMDAETSLDEFVGSHSIADTGDYGSHWKEDELRNHFSVDAPAASELERCRFDSYEIIQLKDDLESAAAREAALQQRLNEADQRIDDATAVLRTVYNRGQVGHYGMTKIEDFFSRLTKDSPEVEL